MSDTLCCVIEFGFTEVLLFRMKVKHDDNHKASGDGMKKGLM
ncbi:MAG: hypothetical protein ACRCST_14930 [Turicibacter sp.]